MTNPTTHTRTVDPFGTVSIFDLEPAGYTFRCALCAHIGVDEPDELCPSCAAPADLATKATKPAPRRRPATRKKATHRKAES